MSDNEKEQSDQAAEESDGTTNKSSAGESSSIFDFSDHEDKEDAVKKTTKRKRLSMVPPLQSTVDVLNKRHISVNNVNGR